MVTRALRRKIAPRQGSILGPMVLWVDGGMMVPHSTHGYNSIVVGFMLTTKELLCLRSVLHDMVGMYCMMWWGKEGPMAYQ